MSVIIINKSLIQRGSQAYGQTWTMRNLLAFLSLSVSCSRLAIVFAFFFSLSLSAQQFVDIVSDKTFLYETGSSVIYELTPDLSVKVNKITSKPRPGIEFADYHTVPRPKIRYDKIWVSDGKKIWCRPLDTTENDTTEDVEVKNDIEDVENVEIEDIDINDKWEPIKLPDKLDTFRDFEIISESEAIICGAYWEFDQRNGVPSGYDLHFVFNYDTGNIKKSIERLNPSEDFKTNDAFLRRTKKRESYLCMFDSKIMIVGRLSGKATVLDVITGNLRKFQIIPENEIQVNLEDAVNDGSAIAWATPLPNNEILFCCKMWIPLADKPDESIRIHCFSTLDLNTNKIIFWGHEYCGKEAKPCLTYFENDLGLFSVRDLIKEQVK